MPRKKQLRTAQTFGTVSKAEIFEQLIEKVLGKTVRLEVASCGLPEENRVPENQNLENDLLKLRAKKAALERERDMTMQQKIMGGNGYDSKREI